MRIFNKLSIKSTLATLALSALLLSGCNKDLQLEPTGRIAPSIVFATTQNAYAAINGMHRYMYSQWYSNQAAGGQSGNMLYMEVLGEDFVMTGAANGWFNSEHRWLSHRNETAGILTFNYGFYYALIANANEIIANIDGAEGPQADKDFLKAQALTYRAWSYYQMVQLFGKRYVKGGDNSSLGLSLVLERTVGAVPRNTVEEVYSQINTDLDAAIGLFATAVARPNISHLNANVAHGVKARVALTQQNYDIAVAEARAARAGFTLMNRDQYFNSFVSFANPEWIWGIEHREDQPTYFYSFYAYVGNFSSTNTRGNPKAINSALYAKIPTTDVRKGLWDPTGTTAGFPVAASGVRRPYMTRKFTMPNPANSNGDLMFMRAAEMYLIEAESLAKLGGREAEARQVLFELVRTRDASYAVSTNSGTALVDEILTQRRIELWGEGFRFYDLKRLNLPLNRNGANHNTSLAVTMDVPAGSKDWEFLIPRGEIDRTLGVVQQNPL
ncbi:RagB/SusD family nutrient uptake outer membrane protein [Sphingobacterium paludis]|uniref:SusD-like starch-binding protein associating with outer membrane n=1 Tax=Sphingobacterium paludis TaxID=1476465 RepID=A0A4V3E1T1_9SPHI|nr:RagB/SusD family nutrient uptake outer membrane protein [Sphingobacterium paludis]TDS13958.1 SusD-like starch-binding protein associating with outer membrane [Sphingobacterium paludis]